MTRLRADLLLLAVAIIWGVAFVAQKTVLQHMGPATFSAARFLLSVILIAPLAFFEYRKSPITFHKETSQRGETIALCLSFLAGVLFQQFGIVEASVAMSGFVTALYVLFVPVMGLMVYRQKISPWIAPAAVLSVFGVFLLSGGPAVFEQGFGRGEWLLLAGAVCWAVQVLLVGRLVMSTRAPFQLCFLQYATAVIGTFVAAWIFEDPHLESLFPAWKEILYAGALSGAVGYTLQVVAQQHTPPSDTAVICSGEALFAALAGFMILGEVLTPIAMIGCALITAAILLVELAPQRDA